MTKQASDLSVLWTKHLKDEEERKKFKDYVLTSNGVLNRLETILKDKMEMREVFKEEDFKSNSWAYEAADRNGYNRALIEVLNIISI